MRKLVYALLDDDHGISYEAYHALLTYLAADHSSESIDIYADISRRIVISRGRAFLP